MRKACNQTMRITLILIFIASLYFLTTRCWAQRILPTPVAPVTYNGILYVASFSNNGCCNRGLPTSTSADNEAPAGGYITAYDANTNKFLWQAQIYRINYNYNLETDVQDIYIKNLTVNNNLLWIADERGRIYTLDPNTRIVKLIASPKKEQPMKFDLPDNDNILSILKRFF